MSHNQNSNANNDDEPHWKMIGPSEYSTSTEQDREDTFIALLRALQSAGVQFVRYVTVDSSNHTRCKAVPMTRLWKTRSTMGGASAIQSSGHPTTHRHGAVVVSVAEACYGGLPAYADAIVEASTLDARRVLIIQPDMSTLRVLPYNRKTAMVMGCVYEPSSAQKNHHEPKHTSSLLSPLCTRGLLSRLLETAQQKYGIVFQVGAELEFNLVRDEGDLPVGQLPSPVDHSVFANSCTLTEQEDYISDLFQQLEKQDIEMELVHAESAPGQLELVLRYHDHVLKLADDIVFARETIRAVARQHKLRALFLPKIHPMQAGNGLHLHISFRDIHSSTPNENAIPNKNVPGTMSHICGSFMEGILEQLPSLVALTIPSVNSFRRVGKGCWTGYNVSWNTDDKESPLRLCTDLYSGEPTDIEYKLSDSVANIYLALATVLGAGLDGIIRNAILRPSSASLPPNCISTPLPTSFPESLDLLQHNSLLRSIIGNDLLTNYLALRRAEAEVASKLTLEEEVCHAYRQA